MQCKLVKQLSDKLDKKGKPYIDYWLVYMYEGKPRSFRVSPTFSQSCKIMFAAADVIPSGEIPEKYL